MINTLVTIGMPMYNASLHIRETLSSLLNQSYKNIEIIICDDCSTDDSVDIVNAIMKTDSRIKLFLHPQNIGLVNNFNFTASKASGEFFMWGDQDDLWHPSFIELCLQEFKKNKKLVLSATYGSSFSVENGLHKTAFIDSGINTVSFSHIERFITYHKQLHSNVCIGTIFCGIWKTELMKTCKKLKPIVAGDVVIMSQYQLLGETSTIPELLFFKRSGGSSSNLRKLQNILGHNSTLAKVSPYFERELEIQKNLLSSTELLLSDKLFLMLWSFCYFLWIYHLKYPLRNLAPKIKKMFFGDTKINELKNPATLFKHLTPRQICINIYKYFKSKSLD